MRPILLAAVVAAILVSACDEASAPEGREGTLTVRAYVDNDATGTQTTPDLPVSGLAVTLSRNGVVVATQSTAANGLATFDGLAPGSYRVRTSGTVPTGAMLVSNPEPSAVINFRGDSVDVGFQFAFLPATISGRVVRLADDAGAENVQVVLKRAGLTVATTTTSATGAYQFQRLAGGDYQLEFERAGAIDYGTAGNTRSVTVTAGQTATMDVNYTGSIFITVAEARAAAVGTRVAVIADVTVPAGRFTSTNDTRSEIWVQDATGGLAVFFVPTADSALYRVGQRVEVVGERSAFVGQEQIAGSTATPLVVRQRTGGTVRAAKTITAAVAKSLADEGQLVRVAGLRVLTISAADTSGAFNVIVASAANDTLVIRNHRDNTGLTPASFTVGTTYDITGVLTQNNTTVQVKPRFPADVVAATVPGVGPRIVINELMANPDSLLADVNAEYVELYNYGTASIDLQNWIIADNFGVDTIKTSLIVPAGGYVILGANADPALNGGIQVDFDFKTDIALSNTADRFTLKDPAGVTIDSVGYATGAAVPGTSRGVIDASADNSNVNGANWVAQSSVYFQANRGTPRARNDGYVAPAALSTGSLQGAVFLAPQEQSMPRATRTGATDR